ncbi:MAG: hypothetical protein GY716_05970 [bacterium]|nr:hypothetical protein [bacterium]
MEHTDLSDAPPRRSRWLLSDLRAFFFHRPAILTQADTRSPRGRHDYEQRIRQRTGIAVEQYGVLNIHRIGIEAPVRHVFEELLIWDGDSSCWPNNLASVRRVGGSLDEIRVRLLGIRLLPLFSLRSIKLQKVPVPEDGDNARYLVYKCEGGYPIGVFCLYVRSGIAALGERSTTQFFLATGFNFYGKRNWSRDNLIYRIWATIHNRVTANVLNRFKQLCEWRFRRLQSDLSGHDDGRRSPDLGSQV